MRKLTGAVFVSLDGVMQAPGGPDEDPTSGFTLGGWTHPFFTGDMATVVAIVGILLQALAVLVPLGVLLALLIALWRTRPMRAVRSWVKGAQESEDGND